MQFTELTNCPFCGSEEYYTKQYAYGSVTYYERFDGIRAENGAMYEGLNFKYSGRVYCSHCDKCLGNKDLNELSKAAEKALKESENK